MPPVPRFRRSAGGFAPARLRVFLGLLCLLPSACAAPAQRQGAAAAAGTPVAALPEEAAQVLAADAAEFVALVVGRGGGNAVEVVPGDAGLAPAIEQALRGAGVLPPVAASAASYRLSYRVGAVGPDTLLRLELGDATGARLYRGAPGGKLEPAGPLSVMEGSS